MTEKKIAKKNKVKNAHFPNKNIILSVPISAKAHKLLLEIMVDVRNKNGIDKKIKDDQIIPNVIVQLIDNYIRQNMNLQ